MMCEKLFAKTFYDINYFRILLNYFRIKAQEKVISSLKTSVLLDSESNEL